MVFACMEAEESSALPRITTGMLDTLGRHMARFVLVNRTPTHIYDRRRFCRHDNIKLGGTLYAAISQAKVPSENMKYAIPSFIGPNTTANNTAAMTARKLCTWRCLRPTAFGRHEICDPVPKRDANLAYIYRQNTMSPGDVKYPILRLFG